MRKTLLFKKDNYFERILNIWFLTPLSNYTYIIVISRTEGEQ
jgi:hypothetical protein